MMIMIAAPSEVIELNTLGNRFSGKVSRFSTLAGIRLWKFRGGWVRMT